MIIRLLILIAIFLMFTGTVLAGAANLSWNANTESDLVGYKIYYGTSPRTSNCPPGGYSSNLNVGNVTSYTLSGLTDGATYYFSITAIDTSNNESCFSSEVSKTITITNVKFTPKLESASIATGRDFIITIFNTGTSTQAAQFTAQPDSSNNILMPATISLNLGNYDILTSTNYYLKKKSVNINLVSNSTITLPKLLAGNLNNDNIINEMDWSVMSPAWGTSSDPSDINKDGIVNEIDFSWMNSNWALTGD